eukprot:4483283-Pyramimonas_sp.AAC.2
MWVYLRSCVEAVLEALDGVFVPSAADATDHARLGWAQQHLRRQVLPGVIRSVGACGHTHQRP